MNRPQPSQALTIVRIVPQVPYVRRRRVLPAATVVSSLKQNPMVWILVVDTPDRPQLCVGRIVYAG